MIRIHNGECVSADFDGNPPASIPEQYRIAAAAIKLVELARGVGVAIEIEQRRDLFGAKELRDLITVRAVHSMAEKGGAL